MRVCEPDFRNRLRCGFTLPELLVVIGIIAVLVAILMPVFARAREAAQRTTCLSQMHQAGIALMAYSAEFKGFIPIQLGDINDFASVTNLEANNCNNRSVLGTLLGYMSKERRVLRCPVASEYPWVGYAGGTPESDTNYMTNVVVVGKLLTRVRKSSDIILFQEDRYRWHLAWLRPGRIPSTVPGKTCTRHGRFLMARHGVRNTPTSTSRAATWYSATATPNGAAASTFAPGISA